MIEGESLHGSTSSQKKHKGCVSPMWENLLVVAFMVVGTYQGIAWAVGFWYTFIGFLVGSLTREKFVCEGRLPGAQDPTRETFTGAKHTKSNEKFGGAAWRISRLPILCEAVTSHFPSSVLLSEASFLAWLAALFVTRLSHCWRYYLNSIPLTPSHPKGPLRISRSSSLFTPAFSLCYLPSQKALPLFQPRMCRWMLN